MLKVAPGAFPPPPSFRKLLGPSFILLGLGLGSGEIILWPYLAANYGLGIAWGAFIGITFQFFINMEIERYALARGESVFVGLARKWRWVPYWLILSTFLGFGWPGIIAASAKLFSSVTGTNATLTAIILLVLIGVLLSFGKYIYTTVERFSMIIILIGIPAVLLLTLFFANGADWVGLAAGLIGKGDGYWFLPAGIPLATFLAAFAFSGAGGNLNLTQSTYIREKGYGMGRFMEKTKGLFAGRQQTVDLEGFRFNPTKENKAQFFAWWKLVNKEHFLVFFLMGLCTMLMLLLLSYATTFGLAGNASGITFVLNEALIIGEKTAPWLGTFFALAMGLMLFSTQFTVFDSTSRIMSEAAAPMFDRGAPTKRRGGGKHVPLSRFYYIFLWLQIAFAISVFAFGLTEPLTLLIIGAVINALCMFVHSGLVNRLNASELPRVIQPKLWRKIMIAIAFVFFGVFSAYSLWAKIASL